MGSIAAILARTMPLDIAPVRQMLAAAPHRGSDFAVNVHGKCLLGASNTSDFVDSTISSGGEFVAVFSGKLDNATDLAKALKDAGHPPSSTASADVVASAFKAYGLEAPNRMRGVFAGIVTDGRQMWCFRDHLGLKPLVYRDDPRGFFVAMEPKQIVAGAGLRREPNLEAVNHTLFGRTTDDIPCALQGVSRLAQARVLAVKNGGAFTQHTYWHPEKLLETARFSPAEVAERFSALFEQAAARSLTGQDVVSLSGGIDSPAVAAFAAPEHLKLTGQPLSALSAVFPDLPKVDESRYIQLVVEFLGMRLHTYRMQAGTLDEVREWCELLDGPVPQIVIPEIFEYYTLARRLGFRNVLTG